MRPQLLSVTQDSVGPVHHFCRSIIFSHELLFDLYRFHEKKNKRKSIFLLRIWNLFPLEAFKLGCLVLVGNDIELDAIGRQFEPYLYRRMRSHAGGALVVWPGMLFPNSSGIEAAENPPTRLETQAEAPI